MAALGAVFQTCLKAVHKFEFEIRSVIYIYRNATVNGQKYLYILVRKGFCVTLFYNAQFWFDDVTSTWCFTYFTSIQRTAVLAVYLYVM